MGRKQADEEDEDKPRESLKMTFKLSNSGQGSRNFLMDKRLESLNVWKVACVFSTYVKRLWRRKAQKEKEEKAKKVIPITNWQLVTYLRPEIWEWSWRFPASLVRQS